MSVYGDASMDGWKDRDIGDLEREVTEFLADEARTGSIFVKSPRIADEFGVTTARAGQAIALLHRDSAVLDIERWSSETTTPAVWRVTCTGPTPYGRECMACEKIVPEDAETCPHCGRGLRR